MKKILTIFSLLLAASWVQAQSTLTFRVDMSNQTVSSNGVHVAGNWQEAAGYPGNWNPGSAQMTDANSDGIYELTVTLAEGVYEYKFINGNSWGSDESVPGACNVFGNRQVTVGPGTTVTPAFCFGTCDVCLPTTNVTFKVDMSNVTPNPSGVSIAGSFQGWNPGQIFLTDDNSDGIYEVTVPVSQGTWQFKFINGTAWGFDESVPGECAVSNNREFTVGASPIVVQYCFAQCTPTCQADPPAASITFRVDMSQQAVSEDGVFVMGSFTTPQWQGGAIEMDDEGDGIYSATLMVSGPANIQYKFANGDVFAGEESGDFIGGGCGVDNGFGGSNRTLTRSGTAEVLPTVCFNSCTACATGTTATASLLTLPCGGKVIQIEGAIAGPTGGGNATSAKRTAYIYAPDGTGGTPTFTGAAWPYFTADAIVSSDPAITATLSLNSNGVILVNNRPAYQFVNDADESSVAGTFGPWSYLLPDGTPSQNACPPTCNVNGGTVSSVSPRTNLCVGDGFANVVAVTVSGNTTPGRFGLVRQSDLAVIATNSTGNFNMESFPAGNYFAAYAAVDDLANLAGVTNVNQLSGCYDLSNTLTITSLPVSGGTITANSGTTVCAGTLSFSVTGQAGTTFRWALLNQNATQVIAQNTTGVFDFTALANGTYRIAHVASRGVNLATVVPPTVPECVSASNLIQVTKSCPSALLESLPNPTTGTSWVTFTTPEETFATLEVFDLSGRKVAELYRQNAMPGAEYRLEFDGNGMPNGVYIYRLTTGSDVTIEKFVIAR